MITFVLEPSVSPLTELVVGHSKLSAQGFAYLCLRLDDF